MLWNNGPDGAHCNISTLWEQRLKTACLFEFPAIVVSFPRKDTQTHTAFRTTEIPKDIQYFSTCGEIWRSAFWFYLPRFQNFISKIFFYFWIIQRQRQWSKVEIFPENLNSKSWFQELWPGCWNCSLPKIEKKKKKNTLWCWKMNLGRIMLLKYVCFIKSTAATAFRASVLSPPGFHHLSGWPPVPGPGLGLLRRSRQALLRWKVQWPQTCRLDTVFTSCVRQRQRWVLQSHAGITVWTTQVNLS